MEILQKLVIGLTAGIIAYISISPLNISVDKSNIPIQNKYNLNNLFQYEMQIKETKRGISSFNLKELLEPTLIAEIPSHAQPRSFDLNKLVR